MNRFSFRKVLVVFFIFVSLFVSFNYFINIFSNGDMRTHALFARQMLLGERPTGGNFLFYWLVNIFSFFSINVAPSQISLCFLLAVATTYKYHLTENYFSKILIQSPLMKEKQLYSVLIAISLLIVMAIPIPGFFVTHSFVKGSFVPNNWYNSTVIFLFPFALLLFYYSFKQIISYETNRNWWMILLIVLNIFIKPSYFFVFIIVYPVFLLFKYKLKREFWVAMIPPLFGIVLLMIEFFFIYKYDSNTKNASSVVLKPLYSYTLESKLWQLPVSLIFSLLFPIAYSIVKYRKIKNSVLLWFTLFSVIVAVLVYLLLAETGPREIHGNFYWQVIICTWLSFFVALAALIKDIIVEGKTRINYFLMSLYTIHVFVGLLYFGRLFIKG